MARQPLRLTRALLAAVRPGAQVFVAEGLAAGIPTKRPRGHALRARARFQAAPSAYRAAARAGRLAAVLPTIGAQVPPPRSQIAVVEVRGVLEQRSSWYSCGESDSYEAIEQRFGGAIADPAVAAVVFDGDTPGGDGPGLQETGRRMRALADAYGKPVLWHANELTCSAGVWLAAAVCDGIYTPPMGRIGSVGCLVVHQSEARALVEAGLDTYIARDPEGKAVPNDLEELTPLGKTRLDELAAEGAARFFAALVARRPVTEAQLRAQNAAIFTGAAAVAAGLADGIGSLEDTIALAGQLAALQEAA